MERNLRKTRVGKVVSNKMDKTIVVAVEDSVKHKRMGCYEVTLNVWAGNTSAEKFYEKMGMKTKERQMEYIL